MRRKVVAWWRGGGAVAGVKLAQNLNDGMLLMDLYSYTCPRCLCTGSAWHAEEELVACRSSIIMSQGGAREDMVVCTRAGVSRGWSLALGEELDTQKRSMGRRSPAVWRRAMRKKRRGDGKKHLSCCSREHPSNGCN